MTNDENVHAAATEMVRRVQAGATLTTALAREVIRDLGATVTPTAVMFEAAAVARAALRAAA
jgi:hypothetical protein